jgi:hypothetical protein
MMSPSITSSDRPYLDTVFGERRRSLVNTAEAGDITGKVAWKGPLGPKQPGGTFNYDSLYFSSGTNSDFTRSVVVAGSDVPETLEVRSPNAFDIIYTLTDGLSLRLYDQPDPTNPSGGNSPVFELDAMTYVQLPEGTRYSLANTGSEDAQALSIHTFNSPIAPDPKISVKKEVLSLDGNRTLAPLEFKLRSVEQGSDNLAQLAVFPTDARGRILSQNEGHHPATFLKPGSNRFKLEALQQAKLVTTLIGNKKIQPNGATSTLSNFTSNNLSFLTVEGTTLADVLSKAQDGNNRALSSLRFGSSAVSLREGVGGGIRINGKNGLGFQLEVKPGSNGAKVYGQNYRSGIDFPNGRFNWNVEENLLGLLDLTYTNNRYSDINSGSLLGALVNVDSITGKTQVSGSASGQALAVGFYQVQDENGGVFDPITMTVIEPTARNKDQYLQAVLITANSAGKGYSQLGSQDRLNTNLEGGYLYAPFVQIMGRTGPELYLPYKEVSADNGQHVVPVANNSWALNTSPDPGRLNVYDTNLSLTLNIAPPFVLPPA